MDELFPISERARALDARLARFMDEHVLPAEAVFAEWSGDPARRWTIPPRLEELKARARAEGLWNLFLPAEGLSNLEYAPLA